MRKIIITADDYGLAVPVNEAVEKAHSRGILTAASLMVGADAVQDAVTRARRLPMLKVGLHLVAVRGRSVLSPNEIPDLVDHQGRFRDNLVRAGFAFFFGSSVRRQLEAEIRAQFEAFRNTGLSLDHVNAHHHMHLHPTVLSLILKVGRDYGVRAVRLPYEPFLPSWRAARKAWLRRLLSWWFLAPWTGLMRARLKRAHVQFNDYMFGMNDTGRMDRDHVRQLLVHLPEGISEIYFHPAVCEWPGMDPAINACGSGQELKALTSEKVAQALRASGMSCGAFSDLAVEGVSKTVDGCTRKRR